MTAWWEAPAVLGAGFWAGMINVVVGSGTLVSFPVLLLCGYSPLVANISNTIGLVGGSLSGTIGYRRELRESRTAARALLPASIAGGITGALLLLALPSEAFDTIVPALIGAGLLMVVAGPFVQRGQARRAGTAGWAEGLSSRRLAGIAAGVFLLGVYGGYFGAAQGILIVGLLGLVTTASVQSLNALKNLLVMTVNLIAAIVFMIVAWDSIDWTAVLLIAAGATAGGVVGARVGRRLRPALLRALIVVIGLAAIGHMLFVR
ncbi:sulfite exporter TauE/SafE family protein [Streptomyces marincola]|uniref:sulfite exporter TauE/SafE family protein n=1 Tax=Streptomyces marincola TaxID=2878388 RepID=UPI001CF44562|nr:sulfite exporter TauE/SafE family protein [Streptomyces marincola]UCM90633.1 sulfite exporter TauE/SafE family protein [Streptomyces marincola]